MSEYNLTQRERQIIIRLIDLSQHGVALAAAVGTVVGLGAGAGGGGCVPSEAATRQLADAVRCAANDTDRPR